MDLLFLLVPTFIILVFAWMFLTIVHRAVVGMAEWSRNNSLSVETAPARVVGKRTEIQGMTSRHPANGRIHTYYFTTFETRTGDRFEFSVPGPEYGVLVEGDEGLIRRQGTRYLGFQRNHAKAGFDRDFQA